MCGCSRAGLQAGNQHVHLTHRELAGPLNSVHVRGFYCTYGSQDALFFESSLRISFA